MRRALAALLLAGCAAVHEPAACVEVEELAARERGGVSCVELACPWVGDDCDEERRAECLTQLGYANDCAGFERVLSECADVCR